MIGKIFCILCLVSFISALFTGNLSELSTAVVEGTSEAVSIIIVLLGVMCLWNGIMKVFEVSGVLDCFSMILSPLIRYVYPDAFKKQNGINEIAMSMTANFFGLGNAATAISLKAMAKLSENNKKSNTASADMISFTVLNTCAINFVPTTLVGLRYAAGSKDPFEVMVPIWLVSLFCYVFAILILKIFAMFSER